LTVATEEMLDPSPAGRVGLGANPPSVPLAAPQNLTGKPYTVARGYSGLGTTPASRLTPPTLPEGVGSVAEIREPWFAVHTRIDMRGHSRDFAMAWQLRLAELPYYHPQAERIVLEGARREKRKKIVSLFSGYLFAAGPKAERFCFDNQELCDCILHEPREGEIASDLLLIEASLKQNPRLQTFDIDRAGIRVRVTRGPWINKEGIVDQLKEHDGTTTVYLRVETLGRLTPLELDISDLERA
jgi:hypothetical protein